MLILYGERLDLPAIRTAEQSLRETFSASAERQVEWFAEYFDFARSPTAEHDLNLTRYLGEPYAGRKIDLIMPVSSLSLRFVLRHREEIFPGVPLRPLHQARSTDQPHADRQGPGGGRAVW